MNWPSLIYGIAVYIVILATKLAYDVEYIENGKYTNQDNGYFIVVVFMLIPYSMFLAFLCNVKGDLSPYDLVTVPAVMASAFWPLIDGLYDKIEGYKFTFKNWGVKLSFLIASIILMITL